MTNRNLLLTMLLGGLWHGAGWTFVAWGALHGLYLVINHAWHAMRRALGDLEAANDMAQSNKVASMDLPLAKVVDFHIERLREAISRGAEPVPQTA